MKERIIFFIVGLLLGAVISTGSIYFYTRITSSNNNQSTMQMPNGTPPNNGSGDMGTPPAMPNQNNSETTNG